MRKKSEREKSERKKKVRGKKSEREEKKSSFLTIISSVGESERRR